MLQEEGHLVDMQAFDLRNDPAKGDFLVILDGKVVFPETDGLIAGGTVLSDKLEANCCDSCPIRGRVFRSLQLDWHTAIEASCPGLTAETTSTLSPTMRDQGDAYITKRSVDVHATLRLKSAIDKEQFFTVASRGNKLIGGLAGKGIFFEPLAVPPSFPCGGRRDPRITVTAKKHNLPKFIMK
jgi:hypothetical protein